MIMSLREIVAACFLVVGLFFIAIAAIGVIRLPDFYTRLHASGMGETLGLMLSFIGLAIYEGFTMTTIKLVIIFLLVFLANPIGTHILCRAAMRAGLEPWEKKEEEKPHADIHH